MVNIVIYTNPEVLEHKKKDGISPNYCFWEFYRSPKKLEIGNRIYFAVKSSVVGSFKIHNISDGSPEWNSETWEDLTEPISCKPFRGFRYKWW